MSMIPPVLLVTLLVGGFVFFVGFHNHCTETVASMWLCVVLARETNVVQAHKLAQGTASTKKMRGNDSLRLLHFMKDIKTDGELFSAAWFMNVTMFVQIDAADIRIVEDGSFAVFRQALQLRPMEPSTVGTTWDWFDFSVEHLSHWWKVSEICDNQSDFDSFIAKLDHYVAGADVFEDSPLRNTIALIPFWPYGCGTEEKGHLLTMKLLTATLKSLQRVGVGRAFLVSPYNATGYLPPNVSFGDMQIKREKVVAEAFKTSITDTNVAFGAISALQLAFRALGTEGRWQSVLFIDPDSILHMKATSSRALVRDVESGMVLSPHRLQPVPHASDVRGHPRVLKDPHVVQTFGPTARCLDLGSERPAMTDCGSYWWACGLKDGDHARLKEYQLMRLSHGSGLTLLAADEHARQCRLSGEQAADTP